MDYFTAYHAAVQGWRLLDERCRVPPQRVSSVSATPAAPGCARIREQRD